MIDKKLKKYSPVIIVIIYPCKIITYRYSNLNYIIHITYFLKVYILKIVTKNKYELYIKNYASKQLKKRAQNNITINTQQTAWLT